MDQSKDGVTCDDYVAGLLFNVTTPYHLLCKGDQVCCSHIAFFVSSVCHLMLHTLSCMHNLKYICNSRKPQVTDHLGKGKSHQTRGQPVDAPPNHT